MSNLSHTTNSTDRALKFLEQNTSFLRSLFANCNHDVEQVTTIIEPILNAPKRCEVAPFYIQAVNTGSTTFLVTNLTESQGVQIIDNASSWLIGRRSNCAIAIQDRCISRHHGVIGHELGKHFHITDLGSRNGTKVNHRQLTTLERRTLRDGDLIDIGFVQVEFFVATCQEQSPISTEVNSTDSM